MKGVYLAGPISGCSYGGATDWRVYAERYLAAYGIAGYSPMRAKQALSHLTSISSDGKEYAHLSPFSSPRAVMTRDRFDATRCDILLVNFLGAKTPSIGTCMEIAWADLKRIPIVCAIEESGNPHEHMMVSEAIGFRVTTLDIALDVIKAILV